MLTKHSSVNNRENVRGRGKKSSNARLVYARDNYEKSGKRERRNSQVIDFGIALIDLKEGKWSSPTGKKKDMLNSKKKAFLLAVIFFSGRHSSVKLFLKKARPCVFLVDFLKKKKAATTTKSTKQNYSLSRGEKGEKRKKELFPFPLPFFCAFRCS